MIKCDRCKGFTLVELIATLAILGIVLLVAVPAVTRIMNNSKRDTFWQNGKGYIISARDGIIGGDFVVKKSLNSKMVGAKCSLPPIGRYTAVDISAIKNDKSLKNSPWGESLESESESSHRGYVIVVNVSNNNIGTGSSDKYVYFFAAVDAGGNGIDQFVDEASLSRSYVKRGKASQDSTVNFKKNLLSTTIPIKIVSGKYNSSVVSYSFYMYCRNK